MLEIPLFVQSVIFYFIIAMAAVMVYLSFGLIMLKVILESLIPEDLQKEIETSEESLLKMMVGWPVALLWILYKWLRHKPSKDKFKNDL